MNFQKGSERGVALFVLALLLTAGNLTAAQQTLPLPATLDRQDIGEVNARLDDTKLEALDFRAIRGVLERILSPAQFAKLPPADTEWILVAQIEGAGVQVEFDFQDLALRLTIPAGERRTEVLNLIGTPDVRPQRIVLPSDFSAYLNVLGGVNYVESSRYVSEGFGDPQFALASAFNFRGWVLENETAVYPSPDKTWEKRDTRVVWDQPERRLRWTLGDLNYPVTGFQSFLPMAGLSLHRENRLQPYRITSPLGQSAFFLKGDSKVEVLVNGHTVQTLQLSAGPHQIGNYPLTGGANNVVLRITDPVGRVEYVNATFFYDSALLKEGETEFNYAAGVPSQVDPYDSFYNYQLKPATSAFQRWGLTDTLTVGVNGQATQNWQEAGAGAVYSTVAGVFDFNTALMRSPELGWGHAERLQYRYYAPPDGPFKDGILSLTLGHSSDQFAAATPFVAAVSVGETWDFQTRYSQPLSDRLSAGVAYGEQLRYGETSLRVASLSLSQRWGKFNTDITVQRRDGPSGSEGWAAFISLIVNLSPATTAYASYETTTRSARAEFQFTPLRDVDSVSGTLGVQNIDGEQNFYGNARYFGRRAELMFSQDSFTSGENIASLRLGTALVYAGGQFGVSRPILDSFALFESTGSLHDEGGLGVQPQGRYYTAQENWMGPAVMAELTSYYNIPVVAEPLNTGADFDPQEGDILLKPTYRSGTLVRIGHATTANVTAALVWTDGKPAAMQSGTLTAVDGTATEFITNREGVAFFSGLPAGTYRGALDSQPSASFQVVIPTNKKTDVDLGTIPVPATE